ncbi:MAG: hypothetical protein K2Y35_13320 [Burkholderiales bacterium]|nr:hypothetical protein [Burkholderiales bacterium]
MSLPMVVDVAIGLSFGYPGTSLFVTIVNEVIAQIFTMRGRQLVKNLRQLIDDPAVVEKPGRLPTLAPFFAGRAGLRPSSYVAPTVLAQAQVPNARHWPRWSRGSGFAAIPSGSCRSA